MFLAFVAFLWMVVVGWGLFRVLGFSRLVVLFYAFHIALILVS